MRVKWDHIGKVLKSDSPACCVCGYDAEIVVALDDLERLFCEACLERLLIDVLLDAMGSNNLLV